MGAGNGNKVEALTELERGKGLKGARGRDAGPGGEEPDDAFGGNAQGAIRVEAGVAVAFGEASAVFALDEREMEVGRLGGVAEGAIEEELP
jgi:hypothetical protein